MGVISTISKAITLLNGVAMKLLLEHANITVQSIDEAKRFLEIAFPDFSVR